MTNRQRFTLTVEAPANSTEGAAIRQLRAVLKRLLRPHGWRCLRVTPNAEPELAAQGDFEAAVSTQPEPSP